MVIFVKNVSQKYPNFLHFTRSTKNFPTVWALHNNFIPHIPLLENLFMQCTSNLPSLHQGGKWLWPIMDWHRDSTKTFHEYTHFANIKEHIFHRINKSLDCQGMLPIVTSHAEPLLSYSVIRKQTDDVASKALGYASKHDIEKVTTCEHTSINHFLKEGREWRILYIVCFYWFDKWLIQGA